MKIIPKTNTRQQLTTLALNLGLFAGISAFPLHAQNGENIPAGYSEEEWYDPSDWFDGDNIESSNKDWSDNDGWSDSADDADSNAYDNDGTNRASNQARRNQGQNRSGNQTARNQQQDRSDRNQQANRKNQDSSMKKASLTGEVDGFKKISLKDSQGKRDEQTFVRVRLDNDDSRVVSLGSRLILSDLDLQTGDRISVSGRNASIDNRKILVASSIEVDDKVFNIRKGNRPETEQNRSNSKHKRMDSKHSRSDGGQSVSINGTVKQSSKTSLSDDMREENLLVRLELENGKSCVVDLGQNTELSDLDIEKDSEIRVQGKKTKVDGKSLIVARKISVDGDSTRLRGKSQDGESTRGDSKESWEHSNSDESRYDSLEPVIHD